LAQLKGAKRSQIDELIDTLGLSAFIHMPLSRLSGGQVRLLGIAGALLGKPSLLLLDELGRGLDFQQQKNVQSTVHKANTRLVLFSTHIPGEAEGIAERVIVLHNGKLLFCGSVDELRHKAQGRVSSVRVHPHELENYLSTYLVSRVTHNDGWVMLRVIGEPAIRSCAEEPTVEDGYLVLRQQVSEPYD
jgi:ABC-2 type transport system ATP-binding protein